MYSVWPYFAAMGALLLLAATPLLRAADVLPPSGQRRLQSLDGLRGFLALAVVFHHGAIYHRYLVDRVWQVPPSQFYTVLGPLGVSLFFMITAFLFWSRVIRQHGKPNWPKLYIERVFRIGPLYLAAIAAMLATIAIEGGSALHASPFGFARSLVPWLLLGFKVGPDIAGFPDTRLVLAGVTWTLRLEWLFYLSLPVLALLARRGQLHLWATAILLACSLIIQAVYLRPGSMLAMISLFLTGMLCASLHTEGMVKRLPDRWSSAAVVALLAVIVTTQEGMTASCTMLIGIIFYLVISGTTVFGLLVSRPAIRLGTISYGIYLLQGLTLAALLRPPVLKAIATGSPLGHWSLVFLSSVLLVFVAMIAHTRIELPGIALGKRLAAALASRVQHFTPSLG